ncbi:MAG: hypothetical protein ACTSYI_02840 [Promethearchaeota archaeon]
MIPINLDHSRQKLSTLEGVEGILEAPNEIRGLNCNHNDFRTFASFPEEMFELETLNMSHNRLESLTGFPVYLPILKHLALDHNLLTSLLNLTNSQTNYRKLTSLIINNNKLTTLEGLPPVLPLTTIHVSGNQLENFIGFPALPLEMIPTDPRAMPPKLELEFWDNPLRSFHGLPRYFLPVALKSFQLPASYQNYRPDHPDRVRALEDLRKRAKIFQFSPRGIQLAHECMRLGQDCVGTIIDIEDPYLWDISDWFDYATPHNAMVYNLRWHQWDDVTETLWNAKDDPENPLTPAMLQKRQDYLEDPEGQPTWEQDRYWKPYPPDWYEAYDALYAYYRRSPIDLATSYSHDPASLSEEEIGRLKHEGSGTERDILLTQLPSSDPVIEAITSRLTVPLDSGYSILL